MGWWWCREKRSWIRKGGAESMLRWDQTPLDFNYRVLYWRSRGRNNRVKIFGMVTNLLLTSLALGYTQELSCHFHLTLHLDFRSAISDMSPSDSDEEPPYDSSYATAKISLFTYDLGLDRWWKPHRPRSLNL